MKGDKEAAARSYYYYGMRQILESKKDRNG